MRRNTLNDKISFIRNFKQLGMHLYLGIFSQRTFYLLEIITVGNFYLGQML